MVKFATVYCEIHMSNFRLILEADHMAMYNYFFFVMQLFCCVK